MGLFEEGSEKRPKTSFAGVFFLRRKWIGRLGLLVMSPVCLLAVLELLCHAWGWGYPTAFLVQDRIGEKDVWRTNAFFGYRFFAPLMARSPIPLAFDSEKPSDVRRIAVVGESAAMGDPLTEFSLARVLDKVLNPPGQIRKYELINAGMTAISSPVIVDIVRDLTKADLDTLVVYTGNNEVIGPYGPGTVFQQARLGAWLVPWHVLWTRTRIASTLQALRYVRSPGQPWEGTAMFADTRIAASDPRMKTVYDRFERNLEAIVATARQHGIEVILCTVSVNLSDCPPFASAEGRFGPGPSTLSHNSAEEAYAQAMAETQRGHQARAVSWFHLARDLDLVRIRADSEINARIRKVAQRRDVRLLDTSEALGQAPGAEIFLDHVHFTVSGVIRLARAVAEKISPPESTPRKGLEERTLGDFLGYDDWSRKKLATIMLERLQHAPFQGQMGNTERVALWIQRRKSEAESLQPAQVQNTLSKFAELESAYPWDPEFAVQTLHRLAGMGRWQEAGPLAERIRKELRGPSAMGGLVALVLAMSGKPTEAADTLLSSGPPYGYFLVDATFQLIQALEAMGQKAIAQEVVEVILAETRHFPGRKDLVRWQKQ